MTVGGGTARVDGRRGRGMPELGDGEGSGKRNGRRDGGRIIRQPNRARGVSSSLRMSRGSAPKAVKVVQEGRVLQPSLGVDVRELQFGSRAEMLGQTVNVAAVAVDWKSSDVRYSGYVRQSGGMDFHRIRKRLLFHRERGDGMPRLRSGRGMWSLPPAEDDVPDIAVAVTQEAGRGSGAT